MERNPFSRSPSERRERRPFRVAELQLLGGYKEQQDAAAVQEIETPEGRVLAVVVADGHGTDGAAAAQAASRTILSSIEKQGEAKEAAIDNAFQNAQDAIRDMEHAGGTTATCVLFKGRTAVIGWVGNSEARIVSGEGFYELTVPHQYGRNPSETRRLTELQATIVDLDEKRISLLGIPNVEPVEKGHIYKEDHRPLDVSRSLGDEDMEPFVTHEPELKQVVFSSGDRFILVASDGLWELLKDDAASQLVKGAVSSAKDAEDAKEKLSRVLKEVPLKDNVTVVIVEIPKAD